MFNEINIDRKSRISLYIQIKNQIKSIIIQNVLPDGMHLPSTRKLAKDLGVTRSTIVAAYDELATEKLIESRIGAGTSVSRKKLNLEEKEDVLPLDWSRYYSISPKNIYDSIIKKAMTLSINKETISFASGAAPEFYPIKEFQRIIHNLLGKMGPKIYQNTPSEGYFPLRKFLAQWTSQNEKSVNPDEILITNGALQGLYLIIKKLLDPGDTVIVEKPTGLILDLFRPAGVKILGIHLDETGIDINNLENLFSKFNPKLIYTIPTYQNPSGTVLSYIKRKKLLDLAYKYQVIVIEDDPYSKLYFEDIPPPSLRSLDKHNHVVYISTFSKILFPGLRIGWIVANKELIEQLAIERHLIDLHSNTLGQCAIHEFIKEGLLKNHLNKVRSAYAQRRDAMVSALRKYCSSQMSWNIPKGGFYLWCKLNADQNSTELVMEAYKDNVAFVPGTFFFLDGKGEKWLRLNFSYHSEEIIKEGIRRLNKTLRRMSKKSKPKIEKKDYFAKQII